MHPYILHHPFSNMAEVPRKPRYYVFCQSPEHLQDFLNEVEYYDLKETFVIPGEQPVVCVVMEDPNERARVRLEEFKKKARAATSTALQSTAKLLESLSRRLEVPEGGE